MRCSPKAKAGRLLCVLFLRLGAVSAGSGQTVRCAAVTDRRFPPPWSVEELNDACFVVIDSAGQKLAYVYEKSGVAKRQRSGEVLSSHLRAPHRPNFCHGTSAPCVPGKGGKHARDDKPAAQ